MKSRKSLLGASRWALVALPLLLGTSLSAWASTQVSVAVVDGQIVLTPDPLPVGAGHDVPLTWTITTPGWQFDAGGIAIDDNDGEFSNPVLSPDGLVFHEVDKDDNDATYKYTVSVTDGSHPLSVDPTIHNGGH